MDRKARKMLHAAERGSVKRQEQRRQAARLRSKGTEFCSACYAVLEDSRCPCCDIQREKWDKFCRNCLTVHEAHKKCVAWVPPVRE